ncbi:MAG TPA: ABC transporter ATP-binding protein [Candidatus Omnitrophota bacterium]|nr:ABC transporter ATP-binding protein [Candidatus Omnitrophota bacterium]
MKNYFKLLKFLKGHIKVLVGATACMLVSAIFDGFQLSLIIPMADKILGKGEITLPAQAPHWLGDFAQRINMIPSDRLLSIVAIGCLIIFLVKGIFAFLQGYLMNDVSQRVMRDIRFRLYQTIQNLSLDYFSKKRVGELISRITNDVQVVENAVSYGVTDLFYQSFRLLVFAIIILFIYPKVFLVTLVLAALILIPMRQIGRKLKMLSHKSQGKMADINSLLFETISGVRVVKAFNMEEYETNRFKGQNQDFYKLKMKAIRRTLLINPITEFVGAVCGVGVLLWIGRQVISGQVSFGVFGLFFGSLLSMLSPIKKLSNVNALIQQALAANERVYDVLNAKPTVVEKLDAQDLGLIREKISIKNVDFYYDDENTITLRNINLEIGAGDIVAIVGPTGSGKSTLANLIPRFYDPVRGSVEIDGVGLKDVTFKSLRGQIGIVTQETILFNDTVRANIAYGHMEATDEQICSAAKKAFAHDFIIKLPEGYDTMIGDRGFRLSGGERQRIAIARAILKNAPILILDEATSQLDSQSEKYVQDAIDALMKDRTVICIAHRLSTIRKSKKIVVLQAGKIIGSGSHEDLLGACPLYKSLYETQFQA